MPKYWAVKARDLSAQNPKHAMFSLEYENSSKFKGVPNVPGLHDASHFNYPKSLNRISKKA